MKKLAFSLVLASLLNPSIYAEPAGKSTPNKKSSTECSQKILNQPIQLFETYDNQGINLGVRTDLLYMIYSVPALTFASRQTLIGTSLHSIIVGVTGEASLGCDLALTYTMPNGPGYSFEAGWYHIVAEFSRDQTASDLQPAHVVTVTGAADAVGSNRGHIAINFFDLLLSKDFSWGSCFSLSPEVGVIGGYMDSKSTSDFQTISGVFGTDGGSTIHYSQASKFEGMGIKLGTGYKFDILYGLKLMGSLSCNLLYGFSKTTLDLTSNGSFTVYNAGTASGTDALLEEHTGRAFADSLISLAWQKAFYDNSMFIDIHAGWRYQAYEAGYVEAEAEVNDTVQPQWLFGQGLETGVTFKF